AADALSACAEREQRGRLMARPLCSLPAPIAAQTPALKGCGCIASSDRPDECECRCYGAGFGGDLTLAGNAYVDVSISGLPLLEAAKFFNSVHSERFLFPADLLNKLNKRVRLKLKRKRFADVLKRLALTTGARRKKKTKRK